MIRFISANNLFKHPEVAKQMFSDRAKLFGERLGWNVKIDRHGFERDEYDFLNPIYTVSVNSSGQHSASMRLLPTTGKTMLNDHFRWAYAGPRISDVCTWECTRFCVAPSSDRKEAVRLLAAGARLMQELSIDRLVATFSAPMKRVYKLAGVSPTIVGSGITENGHVSVGYWEYSTASYNHLLKRSDVSNLELELSLTNHDLSLVANRPVAEEQVQRASMANS